MELTFCGQRFIARADRTLYWPEQQALLAADLHWGKDATFRAHGIPVSRGHLSLELDLLINACRETQAKHLWVLGDLCHSHEGFDRATLKAIDEACEQLPTRALIEGNHDRRLQTRVEGFGFEWWDEGTVVSGIPLRHHPGVGLFGHLHPTHWVKSGSERLRLPCFRWNATHMVLPAFTGFSNGPARPLTQGERAIVIAGAALFESR